MKIKILQITILLLILSSSFNCKEEEVSLNVTVNNALAGSWTLLTASNDGINTYDANVLSSSDFLIEFFPDEYEKMKGSSFGIYPAIHNFFVKTEVGSEYSINNSGNKIIFKDVDFEIKQLTDEKLVLHGKNNYSNFIKIEAKRK